MDILMDAGCKELAWHTADEEETRDVAVGQQGTRSEDRAVRTVAVFAGTPGCRVFDRIPAKGRCLHGYNFGKGFQRSPLHSKEDDGLRENTTSLPLPPVKTRLELSGDRRNGRDQDR